MGRRTFAAGMLIVMLAACAITYGREFDTIKVSQIMKAKATRDEVRAMPAEPASVTRTADCEAMTGIA